MLRDVITPWGPIRRAFQHMERAREQRHIEEARVTPEVEHGICGAYQWVFDIGEAPLDRYLLVFVVNYARECAGAYVAARCSGDGIWRNSLGDVSVVEPHEEVVAWAEIVYPTNEQIDFDRKADAYFAWRDENNVD